MPFLRQTFQLRIPPCLNPNNIHLIFVQQAPKLRIPNAVISRRESHRKKWTTRKSERHPANKNLNNNTETSIKRRGKSSCNMSGCIFPQLYKLLSPDVNRSETWTRLLPSILILPASLFSLSSSTMSSPPPMLRPLMRTLGTVPRPVFSLRTACKLGPWGCSSSSTTYGSGLMVYLSRRTPLARLE